MSYVVKVDDNFHYQDESERYTLGSFDTLAEAVAASRKIVDEYLSQAYKPGMSAEELYDSYVSYGDDPFIVSADSAGEVPFSAWDYAKERCSILCTSAGDGN